LEVQSPPDRYLSVGVRVHALPIFYDMNTEFTQKMRSICEKKVEDIAAFFKDEAIEAHIFGSIAQGTNDALSDIDIWITFKDEKIQRAIEGRMDAYEGFGQIVLLHEMQNNFPMNGIQTAIIYKIDGELIRVDFYLCPLSSSRVVSDSKILFEKTKVKTGNIIPEIKRVPRDLSDRITFLISMCFNGIKKVVRKDATFIDFIISEFQKYEKEIPELSCVPKELSFEMIRKSLIILGAVSNSQQKAAVTEISTFLTRVESFSL
jgi:predicted nucleotidyltransferase